MSLLKPWGPKTELAYEWIAPPRAVAPPKRSAKPAAPKAKAAAPSPDENALPPALISVCVTVYNYARFLEDCLNSVAAQTYEALELIIVDDCSQKDDSVAVAAEWAETHKARFARIAVYTHRQNQGPAEARNTAFRNTTGSWIFIIDADNEVYPKAIERLYRAAMFGGFDATYTQVEMFGARWEIGYADIWDADEMRQKNYVDVMALVSREAWEKVDGFSHIDDGWEDYDFWLKFLDVGLQPGYVPEILCRYRLHDKSRTTTEAHVFHEELKNLMAFRHPGVGEASELRELMPPASEDGEEEEDEDEIE